MKKNNQNNDKKEVAKKILKKGLNITSYICTGLLLTLFLVSGVTSCNNKANKKHVDNGNSINEVKKEDNPNFAYNNPNHDYLVLDGRDFADNSYFNYVWSRLSNVYGTGSSTLNIAGDNHFIVSSTRGGANATPNPSYYINSIYFYSYVDGGIYYHDMYFRQSAGTDTDNDYKFSAINPASSNMYVEASMRIGGYWTNWALKVVSQSIWISKSNAYFDLLGSSYEYYYQTGKTQGTSEGYETGYSDGYATGYSEGYETGYSEGINLGGNSDGLDDDRYLQITINEFYPAGLLSLGLKRVGLWSAPAVDPALNQRYHSYGIVFHHVPFISAGKEYDTILLRISNGYDSINVRNPVTGDVVKYVPDNIKVSGQNTSVARQLFFVDSLLYLKSANNNLFGSPIGDDGLSDYYQYWDIVAYNYFNGLSPNHSSENSLTYTPNSYSWTDINYQNIYIDKTTNGYTNWYQASAYDSSFYNYNVDEIALKDTGGKRLSAMTDASIYATTTFPLGSKDNNVFNLLQRAFTSVIPFLETNIVAGVTIGSLIFLPLLVSVIIVVIKLLKR